MKKNILILTLIAAALLGDASAYDPSPPAAGSPPPSVAGKPLPPPPPPPPSGGGGTNCATSSWNPELYSFYGAKGTIVEKLGKIPAKLSERRVFVQVTQGDSSADVKLYEQQGNGTFTVTEWTTTQTSSLLADIDKAIV